MTANEDVDKLLHEISDDLVAMVDRALTLGYVDGMEEEAFDKAKSALLKLISDSERRAVRKAEGLRRGKCSFEDCKLPAAMMVRTVCGLELFCPKHASYVEGIEREWEKAEDEWHEPPLEVAQDEQTH